MVVDRIPNAFTALPIMLAHPNPATVLTIIEPVRIQHALDRFQSHRPRILCRHLVARRLDRQPQLVPDLRVEMLARLRMQFKISEQNPDLRNTRRILAPVRMNHRQSPIPQIQHAHRALLRRHAVLRAQAPINLLHLALQSRIDLCRVIDSVILNASLHQRSTTG